MEFHDVLLRRGILIAQEILKFIAGGVVAADGHVEGLVGPGKMRFHALDRGQGDAEGLGDAMTVFIGHGAVGILDEAGAHAAQVEEKPFLRCGGADPDDRRIAQHIFLNTGENPPRGIGRKSHVAIRIEPGRGLHQSDIAFLDEIAERQAVAAET